MATQSSNLTAGAAITAQGGSGQGGRGRAAGLVATAALGLALLGGLVFNQAQQAAPAFPSSMPTTPPSAAAQAYALNPLIEQNALPETLGSVQVDGFAGLRFWEQNTQLPTADSPAFVADRFTYREDHRASALATHGTGPADEYGQADRSATAFVPDRFTYREDHRAATTTQAAPLSGGSYADIVWELEQASRTATLPFVADPFTYREDHRASTQAGVTGFLPGRYSLWLYA